ncbi:BrnT family toxin [Candidatus Sumerlaeota bacterium]|nr:BrnT family toxin [Candidatus Sumerlaeota bacterium]
MRFEFDSRKSQTNKAKHDIDFVEAQALWEDRNRIEIPARTEDEPRFMVIGRIENRLWAAVITHRGDNIRIISVRPARREEVEIHES